MCGIAGIVSRENPKAILARLKVAAERLQHRGPDGEGFFVSSPATDALARPSTSHSANLAETNNVGLAHRRLAIIDLSACGAQPMTLPGSGLHIVLNGEIYNYRELRTQLEGMGRRFSSQSDTEVLLAAYAEWGMAALLRLQGMFAFAILDIPQKKLLLARDYFGIKPLFYAASNGRFQFASEIPALLSMNGIRRRADAARVFEHLNYWTTDQGESTFFADIKKLPPAHYMEISLDTVETRVVRYWDVPRDRTADISLQDAAAQVRDLFMESVALHLRSDVPVSVALSGGTDSSSVVMAARQLMGAGADLATVSYIASDPRLCEEIWIDTINLAAKTTPHKLTIDDADLGRDFEKLVALQAQPFVTPVVYAQHRVFRKARECGFKVLLEGQGADELLAGYPFYQQARLASLLRGGHWLSALRFARTAPARFQTGAAWMVRNALKRALPKGAVRGVQAIRSPGPRGAAPWIDSVWAARHGVANDGAPLEALSKNSGLYLRDMIYDTVFATKLPGLLRYGDHNAMSVSVENRVPFLAPKLATFLFSLPEEYIIGPTGETKAVFREAMKGTTPEFILRRTNKIGFEPPYRAWMNGMRGKAITLLSDAGDLGVLDPRGVRDLADHIKKDGIATDTIANRLWRLVSLVQWSREFGVVFD